ncbi:MAG: hypothetical protein A2381_04885 [Bdellovibrionales bacterium RIFOXYB1_FULL_37_110]|nr:MAG: hypothetical protein A2181_01315 [Bdellovibrionales bacterium RIFOXYA1_FULL_38_20]OFZ50520.1 MAG: hypothetical protein A2417_10865 [Bdellovibrionales bacterium RIFOXYC1_FULL_37_79]OFZ58330.1 MAG: hypothetical protein A2328_04535 [Bdellovibrionales bacterium RIFOXYB2_FULL_36_6]OFZ60791.1 MAG: hypothetical protein A2381_04885 [Bdellovibrionales bacterium RIFOXYB1_FULL_37_110]OFZ64505.1 MAG: hypothetical protein A2577_08850 [Bdellovibrionales bacterium RIFOXYD1_FULL_36_51]
MTIYADYAGSSILSDEVKEYLLDRIKKGPFANPNAIHKLGRTIMSGLSNARNICAQNLKASPEQIIFNSGSTEGVTTVFHSLLTKNASKRTVVISAIEHPCVSNVAKFFQEKMNFDVIVIPVNEDGVIDYDNLKNVVISFKNDIALVAIMAANNETGVIQPVEKIAALLNESKIPFLCDTTQYIGKIPFDFTASNIDYAVLSGHKIGALTGIGLLIAKDPTTLSPLLIGGGQENGLRGGTQNYIGIETFAVAINEITNKIKKFSAINTQKIAFEKKIKELFPEVFIVGENAPRLPGTTYISYPGLHGQAIQIELESQNIFVSTSSACSDNEMSTSKILKSMGINDVIGRGVIRISLNHDSGPGDYDVIFKHLSSAYKKLSKLNQAL